MGWGPMLVEAAQPISYAPSLTSTRPMDTLGFTLTTRTDTDPSKPIGDHATEEKESKKALELSLLTLLLFSGGYVWWWWCVKCTKNK